MPNTNCQEYLKKVLSSYLNLSPVPDSLFNNPKMRKLLTDDVAYNIKVCFNPETK